MIFYILCLSLGLFSSQLTADQNMPDVVHDKRQMINKTVQNVNELFDGLLCELNESATKHNELKIQLMSLEREAEQKQIIQAELTITQKDLQRALENESILKNKLSMVQQQAGKEINHMRNEFEAFKTRLETTTNNFDKVFW